MQATKKTKPITEVVKTVQLNRGAQVDNRVKAQT